MLKKTGETLADFNQITLIGRLCADPELIKDRNDLSIAKFTIATADRWKDRSTGMSRERTEFVPIKTLGRLAETCAENLKKGATVFVTGKLTFFNNRNKKPEDGALVAEVLVKEIQFLDRPERADDEPKEDQAAL